MMTDDLMQMKCEADTYYGEFRKMFLDSIEALDAIRMDESMMTHADKIEKFLEKLLHNRLGHLRSLNHEKHRHKFWKKRAIELGWKGENNEEQ